jgi:hypothetical protein
MKRFELLTWGRVVIASGQRLEASAPCAKETMHTT